MSPNQYQPDTLFSALLSLEPCKLKAKCLQVAPSWRSGMLLSTWIFRCVGFFFNMQKKTTTFKPLIFYQSVIKCKACISLRHLFRPCDSRVPASCAFIGHNNFCVKITLISSDACCLIIIKTQPYNRSFCPSWCRTRTF